MTIEEFEADRRAFLQSLKDKGAIFDFFVTVEGDAVICSIEPLPPIAKITFNHPSLGENL
jgi:hypothetical protein